MNTPQPRLPSSVTRSKIFQAYNLAKRSGVFEPKRLNRALGIVQQNSTRLLPTGALSVEGSDWYMVKPVNWTCDCADNRKSGVKYCKHVIAGMLVHKAAKL